MRTTSASHAFTGNLPPKQPDGFGPSLRHEVRLSTEAAHALVLLGGTNVPATIHKFLGV